VGINATNHEVVLVDVDSDVAAPNLNRWVGHATLLLLICLNGGARICGRNGSHTDTSATSCYWSSQMRGSDGEPNNPTG
jgi:hypothetical protein